MIASNLKGGSGKLGEIVKRCIVLASPPILTKLMIESLETRVALPSKSTIKRYELALDISLQFFLREVPAFLGVSRFGHADSSPIAGYDWLWSQYVEIRDAHLAHVFRAVINLQAAVASWASDLTDQQARDTLT